MVTKPAGSNTGDGPALKISDPAVMRALAHPARLEILDHLGSVDSATATESAKVCGLSPSATSYHLRAMAKAGLIEEAPGRGDGRERLWRSSVRDYQIDRSQQRTDREAQDAALTLVDAVMIRNEAQFRQWRARSDEEPPEWYDASRFAIATLLVTAEELTELNGAMLELMNRYADRRREDAPAGTRTVAALFRAFPTDDPL
jgi:DNA-binding transcriptional ArsR family regulator